MKKLLFLAALLLAVMQVSAANVDLATAKQSAQRFLMSQTVQGRFMTTAPAVKWTHEVKNSNNAALTAYYIVNTDKGYVIVAGDDRAREVLAYGDGSIEDLNDLPEAMQFFLDMYKAEMEYLQAHPGAVVKKRHATRGISVEPMLTTLWNQGSTNGRSPYNRLCPKLAGSTCLVGCAAVSLAQVMNYWEYPESSPALPSYTGPRGVFVSELPEYTFDWANMRDTYKNDNWSEAERDAIANLMRYVGQAEYMDYGTDVSGADEDQMMLAVRTFGYDSGVHYMLKNDYDSAMTELVNDEDWIATMQAELVAGRPLMYCAGAAMSTGDQFYGHAFNVDGYDADNDTYHVNFGQTESNNGYYAFNAFGYGISVYKYFQLMFVGMQPPTGPAAPRMIVSPTALSLECYAGETTTATFSVVGLDLTDAITVTVNDDNGVFTTDVATIAVADAASKTVTVTYAPQAVGTHTATITLSTPGGADVTVTLDGTATAAPLVVYNPVMLPADSAYINLTSFRADWTDQTVPENVASYTLEVKEKAGVGGVLADVDWSTASGNAADYLPEGWTYGNYSIYFDEGGIAITTDSYIQTNTLEIGTDKVTVVMRAKNYYGWTSSIVTVKTSVDEKTQSLTSDYVDYVYVLNCAENDQVTFFADSWNPTIQSIKIYAGEVTPSQLRATEQGDTSYRLITGITDKFYTVENLLAGGVFQYKVKAIYTDGTESAWSNVETVTLFENGHGFDPGDVNHDHRLSIADVTALIDFLLGVNDDACATCADVTGDSLVSIADVTRIIDMLLGL
ncbi:MAG: C10 family peptidase [Muribaculaceae bacterium]|nr:C10 family peptidase [Muribaculaceae bacterium]